MILLPALVLLVLLIPYAPTSDVENRSWDNDWQMYSRNATREDFSICYGASCNNVVKVSLSQAEWQRIRELFSPPPENPLEERERLADALALLEQMVGTRTGTDKDVGGTFEGFWRLGQMDCIDESTNTITYFTMLHREGLIRRHTLTKPRTRGYFVFGWPHTSAVIRENATNDYFVVDSWFHSNGQRPEIIPLAVWKQGWNPDRKQAQYKK